MATKCKPSTGPTTGKKSRRAAPATSHHDEARRLIEASPEPLRLAILWSIYGGCRRGESFNIKWRDVDFERGAVTVRGKTGERLIWLSDDSRAVLMQCPRGDGPVFDKRNLRKLFQAALAAAEITNFTWHDLRHTHATYLRQQGAALEIVQRSLGHASITTTQRYAHVDDREVKAALAKLPTLSDKTIGSTERHPVATPKEKLSQSTSSLH